MNYTVLSLSGDWEMEYSADAYTSEVYPWTGGTLVKSAVPGYWEDMKDAFSATPFFTRLKINPDYRELAYPIEKNVPDMCLPNYLGNFFYRRTFVCEDVGAPVEICFEGVQNTVSVWLNGAYLGRHEGYSTPFAMTVPDGTLKCGENEIVLSVSNYRLAGHDGQPVVGLTSRAANECSGGIMGEVELRSYVSSLREVTVLVSEDCARLSVHIDAACACDLSWTVRDGDAVLQCGTCRGDFSFDTDGMERWSPENPKLYTLTVSDGQGEITRRFGVRRLTAEGVHFHLNGRPYFLRGVCEHCYYPETVHPTHDAAYYRRVIGKLKELGFNFIRFHTHIPFEEYMTAADELGMLMHVECPCNTSLAEWREIVTFCRRHTSVVIYCCGNEMSIDEEFIDSYLHVCADEVHARTDALFSPMSALRGLEYFFALELDTEMEGKTVEAPFKHHPARFDAIGAFSDMYSSYALGRLSYSSHKADPAVIDSWSTVYNKPRASHEICIDGTYADLSLKERYKGLRIGETALFSSVEAHLADKGILHKAPLYFKNSCEWQRRLRKHCFEALRLCDKMAGYDFLGPIDTHWHTFGYDVGMMNEFYEMKPGETIENVLRYNADTVVLNDLGVRANFFAGEEIQIGIRVSHFGAQKLDGASLAVSLTANGETVAEARADGLTVECGTVMKACHFKAVLPVWSVPTEMKLTAVLCCGGERIAANEWELYAFPRVDTPDAGEIVVSDGMDADTLTDALRAGKNVLLLGGVPMPTLPTSFRIALAGRPFGNLATVIAEHPVLQDLPHGGFCSWQFYSLLEEGSAVTFADDSVPFDPIVEIASTHKFAVRQAALFEYAALGGKLLVCTFRFAEDDPAAQWLQARLIEYARSEKFAPKQTLTGAQLAALINGTALEAGTNTNLAFNANDKAAVRKK